METDQNKDIDLSNYSAKTPALAAVAAPPDFDKEERKKKIQIIIAIVGFMLTAALWGYYFYQQTAESRVSETDIIPAEMIPE